MGLRGRPALHFHAQAQVVVGDDRASRDYAGSVRVARVVVVVSAVCALSLGLQSGARATGSTVSIDGHVVKLLRVYRLSGDPRARVKVDGDPYRVRIGDTFARRFSVATIDAGSDCASFNYQRNHVQDAFTLCAN